jgi:hypothetical protein
VSLILGPALTVTFKPVFAVIAGTGFIHTMVVILPLASWTAVFAWHYVFKYQAKLWDFAVQKCPNANNLVVRAWRRLFGVDATAQDDAQMERGLRDSAATREDPGGLEAVDNVDGDRFIGEPSAVLGA